MITILSGASESIQPLLDLTSKNHQVYADNWRANYRRDLFQDGEMAWPKLPAIISVLQSGDDVFWIDSDAVFADPCWNIDQFFPQDINLWTDINGPCAGVMAIRNTRTSLRFFTACLRNRGNYVDHLWSDQASIRDLMLHEPYKSHIGFNGNLPLPYWLYDDLHPMTWDDIKYCPGDFLLHAPGLPLEKRIELLTPFCV